MNHSILKQKGLHTMKYSRSKKYDTPFLNNLIMGPNPIKLEEELLLNHVIPQGATVMDLGCGRGLTSVFLVKEYGLRTFAVDLWINPTENKKLFDRVGLTSEQIIPIHADATTLPFAEEFFDAVVSTDSYNFFGRDPDYLDQHLLPFVKHGGYIYISVPGMKKDCHNHLPEELLLSWTPEQLDYIHDIDYWADIISKSKDAEILSIHEMESNEECWNDWLKCDNEYARSVRKSMDAGAGKYLNFIGIIIRRK
jgi:cyclopropane fatty-acyl-phospholipid synthase-like methyltransferase